MEIIDGMLATEGNKLRGRRRAEMEKISIFIKQRGVKWLGYVLRTYNTTHAHIAVSRTPDGK